MYKNAYPWIGGSMEKKNVSFIEFILCILNKADDFPHGRWPFNENNEGKWNCNK